MNAGFIILFLIFAAICYLYTYNHSEWSATTSALQQIWSGNCRLSCRRNGYQQHSATTVYCATNGYDRLEEASRRSRPGTPNSRINSRTTITSNGPGPSIDCVCTASCPCEMVEKVLSTFSPVTNMYSQLVGAFSTYYYNLLEIISDMQASLNETLQPGANTGRQAQISTAKEFDSTTNFNYKKTNAVSPLSSKDAASSSKSDKSSSSTGGCSRCLEKGQICVKTCPNAKSSKDGKKIIFDTPKK